MRQKKKGTEKEANVLNRPISVAVCDSKSNQFCVGAPSKIILPLGKCPTVITKKKDSPKTEPEIDTQNNTKPYDYLKNLGTGYLNAYGRDESNGESDDNF